MQAHSLTGVFHDEFNDQCTRLLVWLCPDGSAFGLSLFSLDFIESALTFGQGRRYHKTKSFPTGHIIRRPTMCLAGRQYETQEPPPFKEIALAHAHCRLYRYADFHPGCLGSVVEAQAA